MSNAVRVSPAVNGTRFGHAASLMVPGLRQYRAQQIGGKNRLCNGPKPQPSPSTPTSSDHSTSFSNAIGSRHQVPMPPKPPIPLVAIANPIPPEAKKPILTTCK